MTWTAPRTWVDTEIPTSAMFNAHIRDNLNVIKTTRNDAGRILGLSSATLADLDGANVTGLARVASGNAFTAARSRFQGTATFVLPVGADKYEDLGGGLRRGNWVEGDYLHHISADQTTERQFLGEFVSTPAGAVHGSLWVEGDYLHYIDADGDERRCWTQNAGAVHSDTGAIPGSAWVETYVHWIREGGTTEIPGHADVAHSDGIIHVDVHDDVAHVDHPHNDAAHLDGHGDWHDDVAGGWAHSDAHGDVPDTHSDLHLDIGEGEGHFDAHNDSGDPHTDTHSDLPIHQDVHDDAHNDSAHSDNPHTDQVHDDTHDDHGDHGDVVHTDQPTVVS